MAENDIKVLRNYFSTPEKPCSLAEFKEFWASLNDEEKAEFKAAELQ